MLAGPADLIAAAREERKRLGGAMRQAGVIAAAGLVALDRWSTAWPTTTPGPRAGRGGRRALARRRARPGHRAHERRACSPTPTRAALVAHLAEQGVLAGTIAPGVVRLVTHLDVDDDAVGRASPHSAALA